MIYATGKPRQKWITAIVAVLLLAGLLFSYLTFLPTESFVDETDVFSVGDEVARGGDVYKVSISQHMPFSYYMAAIMGLFHPVNINAYRLYFYIVMSLLWVLVYLHFRRDINPVVLILVPFLYLCTLSLYDQGTTMLSEHWAGLGHVVMLLELVRYVRRKELGWSNCIWLSASIVLTFGCLFPSAYSIAIVAVGVFVYQGWILNRTKDTIARKTLSRRIIQDDLKLIGCCLVPWVILLTWYAVSGNLQNFFYGAYYFNTDVYSKYTQGFGTDPLGTFLLTYKGWWEYTVSCIRELLGLPGGLNVTTSVEPQILKMRAFDGTMRMLSTILLSICLLFEHPILGVTYFLASIAIAVRGYDHYHAMNFMCATCLSLAVLAGAGIRAPFLKPRRAGRWIALILALAVLGTYATQTEVFSQVPKVPETVSNAGLFERTLDSIDLKTFADIVLDPGDTIHMAALNTGGTVEADRGKDYGAACSTPWTWEGFGEREMETLRTNRTKMVLYTFDNVVWGYAQDEYARELLEYIRDEFYQVSTEMFIRKDYMGEAIRRTFEAGYSGYIGVDSFEDPVVLNDATEKAERSIRDEAAEQRLVMPERRQLELILFELCDRGESDLSDLFVQVREEESGSVIWSRTIPGAYLAPGKTNMIFLEECVLEAGKPYVISLAQADQARGELVLQTAGAGQAMDSYALNSQVGSWVMEISSTEPYDTWWYEEESYTDADNAEETAEPAEPQSDEEDDWDWLGGYEE